jgi:ribosomal protein S18 acetylase RimI-like enzyme
MDVVIGAFGPGDYDEALALWKRTPGLGLSEADSRERIAAFLLRNPGLCFVARRKDSGLLIGTVLCGSDSRRGYLYHLAVDDAARRQGLGRRLAESALLALRSQGVDKCHLMVVAGNELGTAFWRALGWKFRDDIDLYSKTI